MWFLVWIWQGYSLMGQMVSKHAGHLVTDSLVKEVGRSIYWSLTLSYFHEPNKISLCFLLPLLFVTLRSHTKYKKTYAIKLLLCT